MSNQLLYRPTPEQIAASNLTQFARGIEQDSGVSFNSNYAALHEWSVKNPETFWSRVWDYCGIIGEKGERVLVNGDSMLDAKWFPDARLNFAENLLRDRPDNSEAIVFWGEGGEKSRRALTFGELKQQVASMAAYLRAQGIKPGDRIAAYIPNTPEAIVGMLAASSIGAVWSSCSPDFGVPTVLDRFGQIEPKIFITSDGYYSKGEKQDQIGNAREILAKLPSVERTLVIPYIGGNPSLEGLPNAERWDGAVKAHDKAKLEFERLPFDHPLYVMYSSGTTGKPKCIVHGAGGTLIQHLKEHQLQCDMRPGDRVYYASGTGWMMWNWLASTLGSRATTLIFDGDPLGNGGNAQFDFIAKEKATFFGTSAAFVGVIGKKLGLTPNKTHDLSSVRMIASTGSRLFPRDYDYLKKHVKGDVPIASISGGTDIISCFVLGNPWSPVYRGEIQGPGLGMAVQVWDENGHPIVGRQGELVCVQPFPSMPIGFWNDPGKQKYKAAYFEKYPGRGIWAHGDYAQHEVTGGFDIIGRSDSTLNINGIRIGTGDIYNIVKALPEIEDALAIEQNLDERTRMVLFVQLKPGQILDEALEKKIKAELRSQGSDHHVPSVIVQAPDLPYTISGKLVELTIKNIVNGMPVVNEGALRNPQSLEFFRSWAAQQKVSPSRPPPAAPDGGSNGLGQGTGE